MSEPVTLAPESAELVARLVVELLQEDGPDLDRDRQLLDVAEVARRFGVSRGYVYDHADDLGAIRLGDGPRARLRFDPELVAEALAPRPFKAAAAEPRRRRPQRRRPAKVELLPIGRDAR